MLVVLKAPSLADRVAAHGGVATDKQEQTWTSSLLAQQRLLRSRLASPGRGDPSRVQLHARSRGVLRGARRDARSRCSSATVPCRASIRCASRIPHRSRRTRSSGVRSRRRSATPICRCRASTGAASRSRCSTPASTGLHPSLLGSVANGIDLVDPTGDATPQAPPGRPTDIERHGTELAGILVGDRGPPVRERRCARRDRPADPRRRLAAGRKRRLRDLRAHRPADRGARAGRRSERRRRRA